MRSSISGFHRGLLWTAAILELLLGLAYYFAPVYTMNVLGAPHMDAVIPGVFGGLLLGGFVITWLALESSGTLELRMVTYYLITWKLLVAVRMFMDISVGKSLYLWPLAVVSAVIGLGLVYSVWKARD